jgi:hypothetical protein
MLPLIFCVLVTIDVLTCSNMSLLFLFVLAFQSLVHVYSMLEDADYGFLSLVSESRNGHVCHARLHHHLDRIRSQSASATMNEDQCDSQLPFGDRLEIFDDLASHAFAYLASVARARHDLRAPIFGAVWPSMRSMLVCSHAIDIYGVCAVVCSFVNFRWHKIFECGIVIRFVLVHSNFA